MARYSPLLLRVARTTVRDHDGAMDAYARVLEGLRADGFRRLRQFEGDGRSRFETWLAVVARRLCQDHLRARYGQSRNGRRSAALEARARIADLTGADLDLELLTENGAGPELSLRRKQLSELLERCVASLPPEDRLLLAWRFEEELSVREIRELTGAPSVFHIYRRLRSILARLRKELEGSGVSGPTP